MKQYERAGLTLGIASVVIILTAYWLSGGEFERGPHLAAVFFISVGALIMWVVVGYDKQGKIDELESSNDEESDCDGHAETKP